MSSLSLGHTQAAAATALSQHRRIYTLALVLQIIVGALFLFVPSFSLGVVGLPVSMGPQWPSIWGATLIFVTTLQAPGAFFPLQSRFVNAIAVAGRMLMVLTFLWHGGPFIIFALFDLVFAALIFLGFRRAVIAELQTRP